MMALEFRVYNFLNKMKLGIRSECDSLNRYEENIEESAITSLKHDGIITVNQVGDIPIKKDKNYPYLWAKKQGEKTNIFRYSTLVRSIVTHSENSHELFEYTNDDEGVLDIFKHIYCQSDIASKNALVHASALNLNECGLLISGPCRSGKTTLTLSLLKNGLGKLVNEGLTLLDFKDNSLQSYYLPRQVYLRFSSIAKDPKLSSLLTNYNFNKSPQYFDHDALQNIINAKAFHVDAGLTISRKLFSQLYDIDTLSTTPINKLFFTEYSDNVSIKNIDKSEALRRLRENEFPLRNTFNRIISQNEISSPKITQIKNKWLANVDPKVISFNEKGDLGKNTLEDLLYG